jgi:serine/threonine protein kinase/WD40 repeat protein
MVRRTGTEPDDHQPPALDADRDERLGEAIEAYLERVEAGHPPTPEVFARDYPDLGDDLVAALEGLALVQGLVGDPGGPGRQLEEGRRVAGYRIVRELGRGGMGIVYEAVHVGLDRPVALKVLGSHAAPDSSGRRRFLNEAKTAAGLHHTHIVPVFDVGQVGGLCYYAMQRIEGSGLDRVLRHLRRDRTVAAGSTQGSGSGRGWTMLSPRPRPISSPSIDAARDLSGLGDETASWNGSGVAPLSWRKREPASDEPPAFIPPRGSSYYRWVADVGRQAADALAHAHQRGVIHRDIKPSNLLVDARGMIWVADFGLARRLADPGQTQLDSLLGTPRYMSPEQARTGTLDGRSDVYSLGATLYELITLRPPFDGQTAPELIEQITRTEVQPPSRFDTRLPIDLETILLKALAKRAEDRYATADELAEDLARYLAHEPVRARRIGLVGRLWRFARRHPSLTAVTSTAAAVVLTTTTVAYVKIIDERDRADEAAATAKKAEAEISRTNEQLRGSMVASLRSTAQLIRLSNEPNRRVTALKRLAEAAEIHPNADAAIGLRDEAIAALSMRDVEARPPIPTPKAQHGLVFSPNGRRIATLSDEGELDIWDVDRLEPADVARKPVGPARPNQGRGRGGFVGNWIAPAGDLVAVVRPDLGGFRLVDPAAPSVGNDDSTVHDLQTVSLLATPDGRRIVTMSRAASPRRGATGGDRPNSKNDPDDHRGAITLQIWDRDHLEAPRASWALPFPRSETADPRRSRPMVAVAPDGSMVAATWNDESDVGLWDADGHAIEPINVQVGVTALALGPDGLLAVAGGGEIGLWNLRLRKPLPGLGPHQGQIYQLRFSPRDGSLLAAASGPSPGVQLWDMATHSLVASLRTARWVEDLAFAPDGRTLAANMGAPPALTPGAVSPSSIELWSIVDPVAQDVLPESGEFPSALAFGPGDVLAIASRDATRASGSLRFWGGPGRCPPSLQSWEQVRPSSIGFDDRGRLVALDARGLRWFQPPLAEMLEEARLPDPRPWGRPSRKGDNTPRKGEGSPRKGEGPPRKGEGAPPSPVGGLARSRDGRTLAFARGSEVLLWREDDQAGTATSLDLPDALERDFVSYRLALAPDGSTLYLVLPGGELFACILQGRTVARVAWTSSIKDALFVAPSPDGRTLAVAERTGSVSLLEAGSGHPLGRLAPVADDPASSVDSLAFSPDGRTLAIGGREQIRLWDLSQPSNPHPLVRLPGHRGSLRALAFDARGQRLAAADERTVKVWDLTPLHRELARLGLAW